MYLSVFACNVFICCQLLSLHSVLLASHYRDLGRVGQGFLLGWVGEAGVLIRTGWERAGWEGALVIMRDHSV